MPSSVFHAQTDTQFERLCEQLQEGNTSLDTAALMAAYAFAKAQYGEGVHWSGQSFLSHALGSLETLLPFGPDRQAMIGCMLQHVLENPGCSLDLIQDKFGEEVRAIVSGVHLLSHVTLKNRRMSPEHLRSVFLEVSDDERVIFIALCAQRSLLDHLPDMSPEEQRKVCRDSLLLFAPVAARLGIYSLKNALEAKAFPIAYPSDSEHIAQQVQELHKQYGNFLDELVESLGTFLQSEGVHARIEAREKQAYSIFRKMQDKSISHVSDLYDLFAVRVVVGTEEACYQVLGLLHRIGHPVAQRFKDYIGFPKPNGYQSLHTTLAKFPGMPEKLRFEVQIRTEEMHREAEFGIAAHWSYKEKEKGKEDGTSHTRAIAFHQAVERGKAAALSDHIFVLTPKGDVIELPKGSTPLDFAFHVHTNLGISFRAARVNGAIAPLTHTLANGDIVEILRYKEPKPSPRWSGLVKTSMAKAHLRKYFEKRNS